MREHVVVAMVGTVPAKVECTSCHGQHQYRATPPGEKAAKAGTTRAPSTRTRKAAAPLPPAPEPVDLATRLAGKIPQRYSPSARYDVEDAVEHPSFGVGVVTATPGPQKVEIAFPSGRKLLSHDRGGAAQSTLQRPPPRDEEAGPRVSDAPPKPR